jgi:Mce-associated membrane protein
MAKAREVAGLMFTYSPETVRANVDKVQPMLTGDAAQQFETVLSDNQFVFVVDKNNVTSTLSIADAGIVEAHKDSATVLLFMDQTVSRKDADTTSVVPSRLEMDVVKHGGGWKVSTLSLISDDSISKAIPAASAAPTSPSRTTTAPSTPTG